MSVGDEHGPHALVDQRLGRQLGGLAGAIYTFNLGTVHPDIFGFGQLLYCFTIVIVGGRNTPWGMLVFGPILWLVPEFFPKAIAEFRNIAFGVIVIVCLLAMPKGVITKGLVAAVERSFNHMTARRGSMNKVKLCLLVIPILALIVAALPATNSAEAQKVVVDKWEVPFLNPVTGVAAGYGALCDYFQKAATEEINAAGGIAGKPLAIQDCDTAMDPTRATSCMKKAVEKSLVIIGPMTSLDTQVTAPIAAKEGVMTIPAAGGVETLEFADDPSGFILFGFQLDDADFFAFFFIGA